MFAPRKVARARRAEWHCMFTATGFIVMWVAAVSTCTANAVESPPSPCGPTPSMFTAGPSSSSSLAPSGSSHCDDPEGARLEEELGPAVNMLGVGPQGLGGDSTAFAVHVETAATHITMNPVAVNMQCHSARRARATFRPSGVEYGF